MVWPEELWRDVERQAAKSGQTASEYVREAARQKLHLDRLKEDA